MKNINSQDGRKDSSGADLEKSKVRSDLSQTTSKEKLKPEPSGEKKEQELILNPNKPPLALIYDINRIEKTYSHSDLEGIYRLKVGRRRGLDIWIVDGVKVRRELYTDFLFGGNDQRYKFIPKDEIWIDGSISAEELEFTIIHEISERNLILNGLTYTKAHELATQEELKARIDKTQSIDELRERWYKERENGKNHL